MAVDGEMEDRLARIDREEGEVPVRRAAEGVRIAAAAGFEPRPVAIPGMDASSEGEENAANLAERPQGSD